eukprot:s239_g15.t1
MSYTRELVSWPKVDTSPVPLERCLPVGDRERLATWQQHMLRPVGEARNDIDIKRPYMDPILKHNIHEYSQFIQDLHDRSMIKFKIHDGTPGDLGIFFVRKKNGTQRLIFDTRILNHKFVDPPSTDLPSADAFTRLEMPDDTTFFAGSGDLANAFYTLGVPDDLAQLFTLPPIKARELGIGSINGQQLRPDDGLTPSLCVLPMGWSWALHLCQCVMSHAILSAGIDPQHVISDKGAAVQLQSLSDIACGGYVDNFIVLGCDQESVNAGLVSISEQLRGWGLTVHEEEKPSTNITFVGLTFDGEKGWVSIKPQRIVKLQKAIRELIQRNFASGELLELILGHITWALMCRREGLSILKSCYAFAHENKSRPCRLWPSVRTELETVAAVLPLFKARVNVGWSNDVCASDSSPYGYGICERKLDSNLVGTIGGQCEKWRFRFEDAVDARKHAAQSIGLDELSKDKSKHSLQGRLLSGRAVVCQAGLTTIPTPCLGSRGTAGVRGVKTKEETTLLVPMSKKVAERKLKRQQTTAKEFPVPMGLTYLEARSVRKPTLVDYQKRFNEFKQWLEILQITPMTGMELDGALVEFLQEMFECSRGINDGIRAVAAVRFFIPHLNKELVRSARSLKGWHQAAPPQQRMPMSIEVLGAIIGTMLMMGHSEMGLRMFLQFSTYMRPGECSQLTCKQLVPPQRPGSQTFNFWAILLHPAEELVPGKTGIFDSAVVLDSDLWMNTFLSRLISGKQPGNPLWTSSHAEFRDMFNMVVQKLKLEHLGLTLYALRHGGATHDVLSRRRSMLEVKQRGRWSADSSLKRYVKEARLQTELAKVPQNVKDFGLRVLAQLPELLANPSMTPKAPAAEEAREVEEAQKAAVQKAQQEAARQEKREALKKAASEASSAAKVAQSEAEDAAAAAKSKKEEADQAEKTSNSKNSKAKDLEEKAKAKEEEAKRAAKEACDCH